MPSTELRPALRWTVAGSLSLFFCACGDAKHASSPAPEPTTVVLLAGSGGASSAGGTQGNGGATLTLPAAGASNGGDGSKDCERVVEFEPVKLAEPPPFDVVIVADNSDSLSWSRDDLAKGLSTLLTSVRGRSVRIFVLTPTQYGASTEAAAPWLGGSNGISWKDSVTGVPYENAMTDYHVECTDSGGANMACPENPRVNPVTLTARGTWEFRMPGPVAVITPEMSEAEVVQQQATLAQAILALGGGGAQVEQPLCTLNRYIVRDRALLPKNAVFLVISDEDDATDGRNCLLGHTTKQVVGGETLSQCVAGCDEYRYRITRTAAGQSVEFKCVPVDDLGMLYPELAQARSVYRPGVDCQVSSAIPCTSSDLEIASRHCSPGTVPLDCTASCSLSTARSCTLTRTEASPDLCTQSFTEGGATYENLNDYCARTAGPGDWGSCERTGYTRVMGTGSVTGSFVPDRIVGGLETADLISNFHAKAKAAFGNQGYKVQAILLDPAFSCPVQPGQSHGKNLRALASSPSDVFPICEPYGVALNDIKWFAAALVVTEYPLRLESDEVVESVEITDRDGAKRKLGPTDFKHDPATNILTIAPGVLTSNDADLAAEVVANCRPIIR